MSPLQMGLPKRRASTILTWLAVLLFLGTDRHGFFPGRAEAGVPGGEYGSTYFTPSRSFTSSYQNSAPATKQAIALQLAKARINDAQVYLAEVADSPVLGGNCVKELDDVGTGLNQAAKFIAQDDGAGSTAQELYAVEASLDDCIEGMAHVKTNEAREARSNLRKVGRSVASAQQLLEILSPGTLDKDDDGSPDKGNDQVPGYQSSDVPGIPGVPSLPSIPTPQPVKNLAVDYCPNHITILNSTVTIRLDQACGGKFHSQDKYSSGVFRANLRTPVKASGVSNSFYISSNDQASDSISFDFLGNKPNRIVTNYAVNGNSAGNQQVIVVSFDTSVKFHQYTIKWDSQSIMWLVDNLLLRTVTKAFAGSAYPTKPGSVYGYTWDASTVANGAYAGTVDWSNGPFSMYFDSISVLSPLTVPWTPPARPAASSNVPIPMRPLAIDYCYNNVAVDLSDASISYDATGCGGRFRSVQSYGSGRFSGGFKCAGGDTSGLLSSLYLSSLEGSRVQDEIDFEWLGNNKNAVQTNFYVNGVGAHEVLIDLGFDCSEAYHIYTIVYDKDKIQWVVDGKVVRTVTQLQQAAANQPYPVKPVFYYASVWNASDVNAGSWTGKWHGRDLPYIVRYRDITIQGQEEAAST